MHDNNSERRESHTVNEVLSQGDIWLSILQDIEQSEVLEKVLSDTKNVKDWTFVGCGTSFYLAEAAADSWTLLTGEPARAIPASEILLFPALWRAQSQDSCVVVVSRSGQTSEAVRAANLVRQDKMVRTIAITCAEGTLLEKSCDLTIALPLADEKSMVMTRSFTSMLIALQVLAAKRAGVPDFDSIMRRTAAEVSHKMPGFSENIQQFVQNHTFADYVFLGQGPHHGIAREAGLKVMEMSCSYSQSFHTLEFRHGPKAIVSPATCLMFFLSKDGYSAETEVLNEMKALAAVTVCICNGATAAVRRASDLVIELGLDGNELASLAPSIIPAQLLGYFTALRKGTNPDQPKNLSRVVVLD